MKVAVVIEVDDERLSRYVSELYETDEDSGPSPRPDEWLAARLQDFADDDLRVALWGWDALLGMEVTVERHDG